ncbi:heme anaerobic degradation radical SAM methyltransferase ChuW/HutW [Vibrio sp. SCSIO 43140]|uniref:heme anaerobic degradation radical SAM methyltransferase ChuW/HutW n=1 Tax=Vibrio sp. SCSIO 43140 TaxID=2819100 RepID=UPI0020758DF7|nr:heme anaerobic degradation radical SAM methyltransferase ChuW/HutW [Vibrio sp. SCSIO 43140]USD63545.1 heme anaerobic degradation radical SAM methyltransferase ChuW/HutW [Vibrio sp. SCSIO 43140]
MKIDLSQLNESHFGVSTPDPLRFAFGKKTSPHAGGMGMPVPSERYGQLFTDLTEQSTTRSNKRCLYIHIPFCRVRCTFCNFFQNASSRKLVDDYFDALMKEIEIKSQLEWTQSGLFHAVYIGGGTPTDLSPDQVERLGKAIRASFPLATDCEITLEGRTNRFSDEMFDKALEGGFNRFSFGVQSFDTKVRRSAKRLDDREVVMERVSQLAARDEAPIVIDLLYGLPYQTLEVFEQDLKDYMETGAHGVDLYQLVVSGSAPMLNLVEKGRSEPPASSAEKAAMYEMGVNFMNKHFVKQLSVNHWARDNRERSQYNSVAKTFAEVMPLGAGAGGNIGGYGMMHHRTLDAYMEAMRTGKTTIAMMSKQSRYEPVLASLKAGFDSGVVRRSLLVNFEGEDTFDLLLPLFNIWQQNGLVELHDDYLVLTVAGAFWCVTLAQGAIAAINTLIKDKPVMPKGMTMGHGKTMPTHKDNKAKNNAA